MNKIETLIDTYRYICGAYYGICEMDEYSLKEYILKDIDEYIKTFIELNPIPNFDYDSEMYIKYFLQPWVINLINDEEKLRDKYKIK